MEYFSVFKGKFEGNVVNALGNSSLEEAEAYISDLMKNNSSKSALKSSLAAPSLHGEAVKKSASVLANLSSDSDLIVKSNKMKQHKSEKKLAACTSALDLCYKYFSEVAEKTAPTKGDQLVVELALSYLNKSSGLFVESITVPTKTMASIISEGGKYPENIQYVIEKAQIIDCITDLEIAQYVAAVLDVTI